MHQIDALRAQQKHNGKGCPRSIGISTGSITSKEMPTFFYQLTEEKTHYYLLGVGVDQKPFTADDILPELPEQERAKTGLLIR